MSDLLRETDLADQLGIAREQIAALRQEHLTEDLDFKKKPAVCYTPAGYEKIMALLAAQEEEPARTQTAVLIVVRQVRNARIVLATFEKNGGAADAAGTMPVLTLKVPTRQAFTPAGKQETVNFFRAGDIVPARLITGAVWAFTGTAPRFPGDPAAVKRANRPT